MKERRPTQSIIKGAMECLRESAKQHREQDSPGHATMCDRHADGLSVALERLNSLEHEYATTRGLWCFDREPTRVDIEWIRNNAFQLKHDVELMGE